MRKKFGLLLVGILCVIILCACSEQKKQEVTNSVREYLEEQADSVSEKIAEGLSEATNNIKDGAEGLAEEIKENITDNVIDTFNEVKNNIEKDSSEVGNDIKESVKEAKDDIKDAINSVKDENDSKTDEKKEDTNDADGTKEHDNTEVEPESSDNSTEYVKYRFRNYKLLDQHFDKHGKDMGFATREEYEKAASDVINNPKALHKREAEDNDYVYYVEDTNEFVILSEDGYIRTYFLPSAGKKYYDRQ